MTFVFAGLADHRRSSDSYGERVSSSLPGGSDCSFLSGAFGGPGICLRYIKVSRTSCFCTNHVLILRLFRVLAAQAEERVRHLLDR